MIKDLKKKNLIQGYNLSHEEVSKFYDQIEFWISASEESYMDVKYVHISKPSKSARENRKKIKCTLTKEEFLELYDKHKERMKLKFPESDGRLCRYCNNRLTFLVGFKRTNISIDRLDSAEDYSKSNIIFSCGECNDKKNQISIDMCKRILEIHKEQNEME